MSARSLHRPLIAVTGLAAAITLAACSSSGAGSSGSTHSAPASAGSTAAAAPAASGKAVSATETEFAIALSTKKLSAGSYTFTVKNAGSITHALTVSGPGVADRSTGDISPGSSKTLTVTLRAGSYDVFCPVGNHRSQGMDETLKVA